MRVTGNESSADDSVDLSPDVRDRLRRAWGSDVLGLARVGLTIEDGLAGVRGDPLIERDERKKEELLRDLEERGPACQRRRPLVAGVDPERALRAAVEAVLLVDGAREVDRQLPGVDAVAKVVSNASDAISIAVDTAPPRHGKSRPPEVEWAEGQEALGRLEVSPLCAAIDREVESAIEGVTINVQAAHRVGVVIRCLCQQSLDCSLRALAAGAVISAAVGLHQVDGHHVLELQRDPAVVQARGVEVGVVSFQHKRHQTCHHKSSQPMASPSSRPSVLPPYSCPTRSHRHADHSRT
eukprot:3937118-Rhodomonas_salina.2